MTTVEIIKCPICDDINVTLFAIAKDYQNYADKNDYYAYSCNTCSVIFQYPFPKIKDFDDLYPENYYAHVENENIPFSMKLFDFFLKQKNITKYFRSGIKLIFPYFEIVKNSNRILDIGCGKGTFLNILKKHNKETHGLEPDSNAINILLKNGHKAVKGDILSSNYDSNYFDLVILSQVFEHVENPAFLLEEAKRILKPGGYILIITPNSDSNLAKRYKNLWRSLELPRHVILHSPNSINKLFSKLYFELKIYVRVSPIDIKETAILDKYSERPSNSRILKKSYKIYLFLNILYNLLIKNDKGSLLTVIAQKK